MDREIERSVRIRRATRKVVVAVSIVASVTLFAFLGAALLRPSIRRSRLLTGRVERGAVEAVVEASGTVVPSRESVVSSPVETRVVALLKRPGETVKAGDELVRLDTAATTLELERLRDRAAGKESARVESTLALERERDDLAGRIERADLSRELLEAKHARHARLRTEGLVSEEALREAEVEARKAAIEAAGLRRSAEVTRRTALARLEGLAVEARTLAREVAEAEHRLDLASARAEHDGIVTWVVSEEGAAVRPGDVLARVARPGAFRVAATVSDVHAAKIAAGGEARVVAGGRTLAGRISVVYPRIESGTVRFDIELDEPSDPLLRQNLRVDVLVITGTIPSTLRLRRGPFLDSAGRSEVLFVVEGDHATRRAVRLGRLGRDHVEIVEGLREGEEVVVSDMKDFAHLSEVKIR